MIFGNPVISSIIPKLPYETDRLLIRILTCCTPLISVREFTIEYMASLFISAKTIGFISSVRFCLPDRAVKSISPLNASLKFTKTVSSFRITSISFTFGGIMHILPNLAGPLRSSSTTSSSKDCFPFCTVRIDGTNRSANSCLKYSVICVSTA